MNTKKRLLPILSYTITGILLVGVVAVSAQSSGNSNGEQNLKNFRPHNTQQEEMKQAIENGNYETWASLVTDREHFTAPVTEETFSKITEAHKLMQEGKADEAKAIFDELGLQGPQMKGMRGGHKGLNFDPEKREATKTAIENGSYQEWLQAVGEDSPIASKINEGNFSKLVEAHNLKQDGKYDEAQEIFKELDIHQMQFKRGLRKEAKRKHGCEYDDVDEDDDNETDNQN